MVQVPGGFGQGVGGVDRHFSKTKSHWKKKKARSALNDGFGAIMTANGTGFLNKTQLDRVRAVYAQNRCNAVETSKALKGKVHPSTIRSYARRLKWKEWAAKVEDAKQDAVIANAIQDEVVARTVTVNAIDTRIQFLKDNHLEKVPKDVDSALDKLYRLREFAIGNADTRAGMDKAAVYAYLRSLTPVEREALAQEWDAIEEAKKNA